jgi:uncharacterized membrane protein
MEHLGPFARFLAVWNTDFPPAFHKTATDSRAGEFVTVNNLHHYSEPANAGGNEFSISTRQPFKKMKYNNNGIGFNPLREKIQNNTKGNKRL